METVYFGNKCYGCEHYNGQHGSESQSMVMCAIGKKAKISVGCSQFNPDDSACCNRQCFYAGGLHGLTHCDKGHTRTMQNYNHEYCYDYAHQEKHDSKQSNKKGGCYITTSMCYVLKKPDNCTELMTLRKFRDEKLLSNNKYKTLVDEYYASAPDVAEKLEEHPNGLIISQKIASDYLSRVIDFIECDDTEKAVLEYQKMVTYVKSELVES